MKQCGLVSREGLALLFCLAGGLVLRVLALHQESAWGDEALTAACLPAEGFRSYLQCAFERDPTIRLAPLYHGVQYTWSLLFGGELYSLRMLSVTLSAVAMLQLYALARRMASTGVARWAVVLFGLSLFQIYYAQEVRVYALLNVLALGAMHGLWLYGPGGRLRGLWMCIGFNAALLLTHSFTVLLVVAQGLFVLLYTGGRTHVLRWIGAHAALGAAFVAWILLIGYDFGSESLAYGDRGAGFRELGATALQFVGGRFSNHNPGAYLPGGYNLEIGVFLLVALLCGTALIQTLQRSTGGTRDSRSDALLLLLWLFVPVLLLFVLGRLWRPCFFTRYLVYSAIPVPLLAAIGLAAIRSVILRRLAAAVLVGMLLWQNLALPRPFRADYGAVSRAVESDGAGEKVVLALKPFNHRAVAYALRGQDVTVELLYGLKEVIGVAQTRAEAGESVWAVFYLWDDLASFEQGMAAAGLTTRSFESAGMPPLHVYHVERETVSGGQ